MSYVISEGVIMFTQTTTSTGTDVEFYEVVKRTTRTVTLRPVSKRIVGYIDNGPHMTRTALVVPDECDGWDGVKAAVKRLKHSDDECVSVGRYVTAFVWDEEPVREFGHGHESEELLSK